METRKAKLPDGSLVTFHMFFIAADSEPMALVEMAGGNIRQVCATWVEFLPAQQDVAADALESAHKNDCEINPEDLPGRYAE